jgi:hypothetical protein
MLLAGTRDTRAIPLLRAALETSVAGLHDGAAGGLALLNDKGSIALISQRAASSPWQ